MLGTQVSQHAGLSEYFLCLPRKCVPHAARAGGSCAGTEAGVLPSASFGGPGEALNPTLSLRKMCPQHQERKVYACDWVHTHISAQLIFKPMQASPF